MKKIANYFLVISVIWGFMLAAQAHAQTTANNAQQDPYQLVQKTTEDLLALIVDAKSYYQKEPERFNKEVMAILDDVVDFDNFARGVMGSYASGQRFKSLKTEQEKTLFKERIQRFSATFKQGLIDTYMSGLLKFNGQKIETLPPRKGDNVASGAVTVGQNIYNESGKPYVVQYSMRRNKQNQWKLYNLTIEGINLGLTYRSQFAAAVDANKGDVDKVIATWRVDPQVLTKDADDANAQGDKATDKKQGGQ